MDAAAKHQRPLQGLSAWIITTGAAGMDTQTRGVADALGLAYEMKPIAPRGLYKLLAPWGPVAPGERFGQLRKTSNIKFLDAVHYTHTVMRRLTQADQVQQ